MTNKERQKKLDEKKWIASEKAKEDLSGLLDYCSHCDWQDIYGCMATQEEIEREYKCAKAYNKMQKAK